MFEVSKFLKKIMYYIGQVLEYIIYYIAKFLEAIYPIVLVIILIFCGIDMVDHITSNWQKTVTDTTFEVQIVEKSMTEDYQISVQGVNIDGEEYYDTYVIDGYEYANLEIGDTILVREKKTTQPIIGEKIEYTLVREIAQATN